MSDRDEKTRKADEHQRRVGKIMQDAFEKKRITLPACPRCGIKFDEAPSVSHHDSDIPMPEVKEPAEYSDTELLDWLQSKLGSHTGKVICRWSGMGRGWRLHETRLPGAVDDVRQAIINMIKAEKEKDEELPREDDENLPPGGPA